MPNGPSLGDVRQLDIWRVYWNHPDGTGKPRPALAVSTTAQSVAAGYATFLYITSQDHPEVPCRLQISASEPLFPHTGLDSTSWVHFLDDQKITEACLRERLGKIDAFRAAYLKLRLAKLIPPPGPATA